MTVQIQAGERFNMLVAVEPAGKDKHGRFMWRCKCDCGGTTTLSATRLKGGVTKSCGCQKSAGNSRTHGLSHTKTHEAWKALKQRCKNPKRANWEDYGGRGITYDPAWESFETFLADMGEAPDRGMIDRIDNDGPYCKANCKWSNRKEQNNNKRNNHILEYDGKTMTISQWSDYLGIPKTNITMRLWRGWSVERALTVGRFDRAGRLHKP